jgi:hypothetical protein
MPRNIYQNAHPAALKEIASLVEATIAGERIKKEILLERLGTTDGVFAFANLTNVYLQKNYADSFATAIWPQISERSIVQDFRTISWLSFYVDTVSTEKAANKGTVRGNAGIYGGTLPEVAEGEKYQSFNLTQNLINGFAVKKYGAQIGFTWEAFVNDPYNTVRRIPSLMAKSAQNTLDDNATRALYVAANANTHLASAVTANGLPSITTDSALSYAALITAQLQLSLTKDTYGNYITFDQLALTIDPSMVPVAEWILKQSQLVSRVSTGTGINNYTETQSNYNLGNITIVPNRFLAYYSGNTTSWILSPLHGTGGVAETAVVTAFLAGEEAPEVRVSGLAGYTPNGSALPFTSGSFDTDVFDMRVRQVGGAGVVNKYPIIMSAGTGAINAS